MAFSEELPTSSLVGKSAIVTGGSRGIGAGIAIQFARKGVDALAITYVSNQAAADAVLQKCRELGVGKTVAIKADILDVNVGPLLISQALAELETDTIDIIVNNAAVLDMADCQAFPDTTVGGFVKMMQGNVFAAMSVINAAMPHLPKKGGRIINISSIASKLANEEPLMSYGASKAALDSITRSLAATYGVKTGATFNSVNVGSTMTSAAQAALEQFGPGMLEKLKSDTTAESRMGEVEDIAFIVGFLSSEEGRWINGASIQANGGHKGLLPLQG